MPSIILSNKKIPIKNVWKSWDSNLVPLGGNPLCYAALPLTVAAFFDFKPKEDVAIIFKQEQSTTSVEKIVCIKKQFSFRFVSLKLRVRVKKRQFHFNFRFPTRAEMTV